MSTISTSIEQVIRQNSLLYPLDVLLTGPTGAGKSSTLNAIFGRALAQVGEGVDPCTQTVSQYRVDDWLRIHDSPGLGDGIAADRQHAQRLQTLLEQKVHVSGDKQSYGLIDMVLVILDGGSRDMGTAYQLLNGTILPHIAGDRVLVAINQADMAQKGRGWDARRACPEPTLQAFLDDKARSVRDRVLSATGREIPMPVYYSAAHAYNIDALVQAIAAHVPRRRRYVQD